MELSLEDVEHLATLAHLDLRAEEKETYRKQMSSILDYVSMLQKVQEDAPAQSSGTDAVNVFRDDVVIPTDEKTRAQIVQNFPETKDGYLIVPGVFEKISP